MDPAFTWDQPRDRAATSRRSAPAPAPDRITLREAEHRFGVTVSTLRAWARTGAIDAVLEDHEGSRQWMVVSESIAHHLSRSPRPAPRPASGASRRAAEPRRATGPTPDGSAMLVPRDAWDRLMDQLGNLHEAGMALAEARERAARAETEAGFLRERLSEMRAERDGLRARTAEVAATPRRRWFRR